MRGAIGRHSSWAAFVVLALVACGDEAGPDDGDMGAARDGAIDGSFGRDGDVQRDATIDGEIGDDAAIDDDADIDIEGGPRRDGSQPLRDAGRPDPRDAAPEEDAAVEIDSGPLDAAMELDSATALDATTAPDTSTPPDAGTDTGSVVDAGSPPDARPAPDAAPPPDTGPMDAGPDPCIDVAPADRCAVEGGVCVGMTFEQCARNAVGCLVVTRTDCSATDQMCGTRPDGTVGCTPFACGNGMIDAAPPEMCDDGDRDPGDGCSATCQIEPGYRCSGTPSVCVPIPPNTTCAGAVPLTGTIMADVTTGGPRPTGALCGPGTGPALYYSLTVDPRTQVHVTATPDTAWDVTLHVLLDCAASGCLSLSDTAGAMPGTERVTVTNDTDAPITRIIAVAAASSGGGFTLSASANGIPFIAFAASCEAAPAPASITTHFTTGDDLITPFMPLPFAMPLLGTVETHFAVSINGLVQLHDAATGGSLSSSGANLTIPSPPIPNAFIAPFWDDLIVNIGGAVRSWVVGGAPTRKLVVEWMGAGFSGLSGASLRFQAQLYETTGVIELHYCSLMGSFLAVRGSGATIGIEDATGTGGRLVSFNTRDAVAPGQAFRFVP